MDVRRDLLAEARPGERWVVRRRLPDGSATDVLGWVEAVDADAVLLSPAAEADVVRIARSEVVLARRAPAAAGGPAPSRTSAEQLEQIAWPAWVAEHARLGAWVLRAGGGFTARANSCLAVGDPGMPVGRAAEHAIAYAEEHRIPPWAQVVLGSTIESELTALGWVPVHQETEVLAVRLADLLGETLPAAEVTVSADPGAFAAAYAGSRSTEADSLWVAHILDGLGPRAFGTLSRGDQVVAIGRGHLNAGWLGLTALWTRPEYRRQGLATAVTLALGHWAAHRGARWAYLQVAVDNTEAHRAYERLGFRPHHRYRYLAAP